MLSVTGLTSEVDGLDAKLELEQSPYTGEENVLLLVAMMDFQSTVQVGILKACLGLLLRHLSTRRLRSLFIMYRVMFCSRSDSGFE